MGMKVDNKFWLVWRKGSSAAPTKQHFSYAAAREEAERLAGASTGMIFYVLEATTGHSAAVSITSWNLAEDWNATETKA